MKGACINVKKTVFLLFLAAILALSGIPVSAARQEYSWYCSHVSGHLQPPVAAELAFAESCGAYYIDRCHVSADAGDRVIYLTFDVGYENGNVARVLDALREENVRAAFFILGNVIEREEALVRRMVAEGHTVCNHTVKHRNMAQADDEELLKELNALETLYRERIGGELARYYRPPEGRFSKENLLCVAKNGYKTVFWSFAYPDWDNAKQMSPERAMRIILDNAHSGEVMLLHPTSATNAEILGGVIRELKHEGYRFGSLDELTGEAE